MLLHPTFHCIKLTSRIATGNFARMKRYFLAILCTAFLSLWTLKGFAEVETWRNSSGISIEAELVRLEGRTAVLESTSGRVFKINVSALDAESTAAVLGLEGSISDDSADAMRESMRRNRASWRTPA